MEKTIHEKCNSIIKNVTSCKCVYVTGHALFVLTVAVFLTAFPETGVEVSESKLVFSRLPDVVNSVGQLPLSDLGQLISPGWRQRAVVGILSGALCVTAQKGNSEEEHGRHIFVAAYSGYG